jgi:hypothetical protein
VLTVDGEPVPSPGDSDADGSLQNLRLELKLCQALTALDPPSELSVVLHGRITGHLRALHRYHETDHNARQPAALTDDELHQATAIIRALRTLPAMANNGARTHSLGAALGGYALDLADELNKRTSKAGTDE